MNPASAMFFLAILFQVIRPRGEMFSATPSRQNQMAGFLMRGRGIRVGVQCLLRKLAQERRHIGPNFFQPRSRARRRLEDNRFHPATVLRYWQYVKYGLSLASNRSVMAARRGQYCT